MYLVVQVFLVYHLKTKTLLLNTVEIKLISPHT